ncbi:MAG: AMIN-like domain-containing (lipo)protein [Iamia sp.]
MARPRSLLAAIVAVLALAGACTSDDGAEGSPSTTAATPISEPAGTTTDDTGATDDTDVPTTEVDGGVIAPSSTPDGTTTTAPAPFGTLLPKSGPGDGAGTAQLVDLRTGRHDGFDRIVLEFADGVQPGWWVEWVDGPITQSGSGSSVEVEGAAYLQIRTEPASGYDLDAGAATFAPDRVSGPGGGPIAEVVRAGDFEANLIWVAGADERTGFTVSTLGSPSRLVIDVAST